MVAQEIGICSMGKYRRAKFSACKAFFFSHSPGVKLPCDMEKEGAFCRSTERREVRSGKRRTQRASGLNKTCAHDQQFFAYIKDGSLVCFFFLLFSFVFYFNVDEIWFFLPSLFYLRAIQAINF